jgi:biotin carboxylase
MPKRLLLVLSKQSYRTEAFVDAAKRLGAELTLVSDRCHVLAEEWREGALPIEFHRADEAVALMVDRGRRSDVSGVLGTDDLTTVLASRVSEALGLRGNPPEATERARNKRLQRECLTAAGLRVPAFLVARIDDDPAELARRVSYPCVLKPTALTASRGVIRADEPAQFVAAFERIRRLVRSPDVLARRDAAHTEMLVEAFIPGPEFALEALLDRGTLKPLALFDKPDPLDGPFFEETIYVTPSRLPSAQQQAIIETVEQAARALGLREGPIHAEVRLNDAGVWILEVAARTIGGLCGRTLRFGAGVSLEELVIAHATGQELPSLARERQPAGVMMIPVPREGRYRAVRGLDAARAVQHIEEIVITVMPGEHLVPLPEGSSYFGFIFARAPTPEAVEAALRAAHAELHFEIIPMLPVA